MVSHVMSTLHQDTRYDGDAVRAGGTGLENGVSSCHSKPARATKPVIMKPYVQAYNSLLSCCIDGAWTGHFLVLGSSHGREQAVPVTR